MIWVRRNRSTSLSRLLLQLVTVFALLVPAAVAVAQTKVTPNDMARFIAGMPPSNASPLAALTNDPAWRRYARHMDNAWFNFERRQLSRIRAWSGRTLPAPQGAMFYMFGGPDFVHADAFFPRASVYVLSGLEPIGGTPDITALSPQARSDSLKAMQDSLGNFLQYGYFITRQMGQQFRASAFKGTLPILYVFLARTGKHIDEVSYLALRSNGKAVAVRGKAVNVVRIKYTAPDRTRRTLYYFRTDLSNKGVGKSGFLKFAARLGKGDSLIKSASYLMHLDGFSRVRDFVLKNSNVVIQDDSGIPLKHFTTGRWSLRPFGRYFGPIEQFKNRYQPEMEKLFAPGKAAKIDFGIGYRWHATRTNVLVAERLP